MKYIANILTETKFEDNGFYNVVKSKDDIVEGIPTLIIGWGFAHTLYPEAKILEWEIKDNIYWTFGKRERRSQMEKDILKFKKVAMNKLIKSVKYKFFNVLTEEKGDKVTFFNSIKEPSEKHIYIANDLMYIYYDGTKEVIGVSLRDIEYGGGDKKKFFSVIYQNPYIKVIKDKEDISFEMKYSLKNNLYVIPYLCA